MGAHAHGGFVERYNAAVALGEAERRRMAEDLAQRHSQRLRVLEPAIAAFCLACEPSGECSTADCELRAVSPLPLTTRSLVVLDGSIDRMRTDIGPCQGCCRHRRKTTPSQDGEIRRQYVSGITPGAIARDVGVSRRTVWRRIEGIKRPKARPEPVSTHPGEVMTKPWNDRWW